MSLKLMYITNDEKVALIAEKYGVDRVWIDLETLGKEERQKGMNTVKSKHCIDDIRRIAPLLSTSEMLVRINPWHEGSIAEIEQVIEAGAQNIMLPMWRSVSEVDSFLKAAKGRTKTILLLETIDAQNCLDEVLKLEGVEEIHIGLNDLHLCYGQKFMFELLANGTVDFICEKIKKSDIAFGFGGVARIGEGTLSADRIIMEHYRLGSKAVILSRAFCDTSKITDIQEIEETFRKNISNLRRFEEEVASKASENDFLDNHQKVIECVHKIVSGL